MSRSGDSSPAGNLLSDLDDIRNLLDEPEGEAGIPELEYRAGVDDPAPEDARVLDLKATDAEADARVPAPGHWPDDANDVTAHDSQTVTEALLRRGLEEVLTERIDAALEHWIKDTLQIELALLRARLKDAIKTELENFVSAEIRREIASGKTHGA